MDIKLRFKIIESIIFLLACLTLSPAVAEKNANSGVSDFQNISEVVLAIIPRFDWLEPQFHKESVGSHIEASSYDGVVIRSAFRILEARDLVSGNSFSITRKEKLYEIVLPKISANTFIELKVVGIDRNYSSDRKSWLDFNRVGGFVSLTASQSKDPAFDQLENRLATLGVQHYVRNVKSNHLSRNTLWNSDALKDVDGKSFFRHREDVVSRFSKRSREAGLKFIAYYRNSGDVDTLRLNPQWNCRNAKGQKSHPKFVFLDFLSDYRQFVLQQLFELAERGADAIYFDHIHLPVDGCFGSSIEKAFKKATGLDIPTSRSHKNFGEYLQYQSIVLNDTFEYWKKEVLFRYPDLVFVISVAYLSGVTVPSHSFYLAEIADVVKLELENGRRDGIFGNVFKHNSDIARPGNHLLMTLSLTLPRDLSGYQLSHIWTNRLPNTQHMNGFVSTVIGLGGVAAVHVDAQYLMDGFDKNNYTQQKRITPFGAIESSIKLGNHLSESFGGTVPVRYAAVLFDEKRRNSFGMNYAEAWRKTIWPSVGAYQGFLDMGVPVNAISEGRLVRELKDYKVLFVPSEFESIEEDMQRILVDYSNLGGKVIYHNPKLWAWDDPAKNQSVRGAFLTYLANNISLPDIQVIDNSHELFSFAYIK